MKSRIAITVVLLFTITLFGIVGCSKKEGKISAKKVEQKKIIKEDKPSNKTISRKSWGDLSMTQRKDIYLRVTDFPPGREADQELTRMAKKYNIPEGDVLIILQKGTFEWGWGNLP